MKALKKDEQKYIEGYAAALQDIMYELTGDDLCSKSYDPMTCEASVMHSYAFDMKDGGRHHDVEDYKDLEEIKRVLLWEIVSEIQSDLYSRKSDK
jgi:hypothetical protein